MNQSSYLHRQAFIEQLYEDGEIVTINNQPIMAILDRQPRLWDMHDAGYLDKQPINVEVLKGTTVSTGVFWNCGISTPLDMRGFCPVPRQTLAIIDGINKKVMTVTDAIDRWILTTITLNT